MASVTEAEMAISLLSVGGTACIHRFLSAQKLIEILRDVEKYILDQKENAEFCSDNSFLSNLKIGISLGVNNALNSYILDEIKDNGLSQIVGFVIVDVAHGHHQMVFDTIDHLNMIKSWNPIAYGELDIIVGNICTTHAALDLKNRGISAIKVGVGPGSRCTTRISTGMGCPQLSAIKDISETMYGSGIKIIADGGFINDGDLVKAFAAGADFCMSGSMFAGTRETPGNQITIPNGPPVKIYEGSASTNNQVNFSNKEAEDVISEGVTTFIQYRGNVNKIIKRITGHIQSGMSYAGVNSIEELKEYGKEPSNWVRITHSGFVEGTPHGA
jgi:IMP dehydrogenase